MTLEGEKDQNVRVDDQDEEQNEGLANFLEQGTLGIDNLIEQSA